MVSFLFINFSKLAEKDISLEVVQTTRLYSVMVVLMQKEKLKQTE